LINRLKPLWCFVAIRLQDNKVGKSRRRGRGSWQCAASRQQLTLEVWQELCEKSNWKNLCWSYELRTSTAWCKVVRDRKCKPFGVFWIAENITWPVIMEW